MASQTHNPKGFLPVDMRSAVIRMLPIASSQTLARGDAVILSSGQIAIALANSAELCGVVARDCASLAAGTLVPVWADPDTIFVGRTNSTNSAAIGAEVDLVGATGAMEIDENASTMDIFVLCGKHDPNESAGAGERLYVRINKHAFADTAA